MGDEGQVREITLDQMMTLRASTEAVGSWLRTELEDRLETIRPLLAPRRFLGEHIKSAFAEEVRDADKTFQALQSAYREISGEPLRVSSRLDSPIDPIPGDLQVHSWEFAHQPSGASGAHSIMIKSPVTWVLTYASPVSWGQIRQMLTGTAPRNEAQIKQFAVSAVVLKMALDRNPGITRLLKALRLQVEFVTVGETGKLPVVRLGAPVPAFRPVDSVILNATRLSGVTIFEELIDPEAVAKIDDPFRARLLELGKGA